MNTRHHVPTSSTLVSPVTPLPLSILQFTSTGKDNVLLKFTGLILTRNPPLFRPHSCCYGLVESDCLTMEIESIMETNE